MDSPAEKSEARASLKIPSIPDLATGREKPPLPEELESELGSAAENWFFSSNFGKSALTIGAILVFPPYAIYVLGNAALVLTGNDEIYLTDALPENERAAILHLYEQSTSLPGRLNAVVFDHEFVEKSTVENNHDEDD